MSRIRTFSRFFPSYHLHAGKPTFFVEKILRGLIISDPSLSIMLNNWIRVLNPTVNDDILKDFIKSFNVNAYSQKDLTKYHTIREGNHFKPGDKFSPRVWSGKPYQSKQIIIAPDIEVKKTWDFKILPSGDIALNHYVIMDGIVDKIAKNDGLSFGDFLGWFKLNKAIVKPFNGQIIAWDEKINY